ncbi:unnamed protein product [Ceutorhynchus assimilis]|uniref:Uncharacterized protein n=1 Tax=Ceutorhynchus assimilis TaxID=467358 RepID=A0A9N9MTA6_9CUCU|nr:unnamed protein product [Ceutorhynchus assimilis]
MHLLFQAVVTEFLICYADLIFCDHLPSIDQPELAEKENLLAKKCRPNSLAISTPTKLITLEEARTKHSTIKSEECNYIEVGGGPNNLPKKYHTIIELPPGARKRGHTKRSPLGWRMFFTRSSRSAPQGSVTKSRKASTPITINDKSVTESDLTDMRRKLRSVKSAESLTSGHSEPASTEDVLGPLHSLNKPPGHNRSVSHDSYFDTLQSSQNNSEGSLLDLSEIHLNFDLEESEMRIFSEDESLVSSPRIQKDLIQRRILTRARPEDYTSATNSVNPSPKKQARVVLSPESMSRKRTRLEDQLSDIQYIDCNTPENVVSTTAVVHAMPISPEDGGFSGPKNKSPRNSDNLDNKRQSLNLESTNLNHPITKSYTDLELNRQYLAGASLMTTTPTPTSPGYKQLGESSGNTTPGYSPNCENTPPEIGYENLRKNDLDTPKKPPLTPNYENILTTISITYKSPPRSAAASPMKNPVYENVILNAEKVDIPTSTASLPIQEASQPDICDGVEFLSVQKPSDRPKSLSALEDNHSSTDSTIKANSSSAICNTSEQSSLTLSLNDQRTVSSNQSSGSNIQYTASLSSAPPYHYIDNSGRLSPTDLSLSEVVQSSLSNLTTSQTSISTPISPSKISPNVSPTTSDSRNLSNENLLTKDNEVWSIQRPTSINLIDFSPQDVPNSPSRSCSQNDKRKSDETESYDENAIYQQVKYFRRSIHEVNALLDMDASEQTPGSENIDNDKQIEEDETNFDSLENEVSHVYENLEGESLRHDDVSSSRSEDNNKTDETDATSQSIKEEEVVEAKERFKVKDLTSRFEVKKNGNVESGVKATARKTSLTESGSDKGVDRSLSEENASTISSNSTNRMCMFYEKENSDFDQKSTISTSKTHSKSSNSTSKSSNRETLSSEKSTTEERSMSSSSSSSMNRLRIFYEKDSLPPCLRARNLKNQLKTRSLDEDEFEKECGLSETNQRRKSMDENIGYKTNSLPKVLNQPKLLPKDENGQMESLHLSHSSEKINMLGGEPKNSEEDEEQKKRERIEKYKEERRRILSEKFRSESFKEDKDILRSRLRIYKGREEPVDSAKEVDNDKPLPARRKSTKSESESMNEKRLSEEITRNNTNSSPGINPPAKTTVTPSPAKSLSSLTTATKMAQREPEVIAKPPKTGSLKVRAAVFEQNQKSIPVTVDFSSSDDIPGDLKDLDFIRHKRRDDEVRREERRRHTFETRERETESERLRRVSMESRNSPRKEKASPTYCIKDMKAIFESKSKQ